MMLSDFGLAKRLDHGQSSYIQTGKNAIGSVGWRAPECLRGDVQLDDLSEGSTLSGSLGDDDAPLIAGRKKAPGSRLTKAVDLFALGCLYFYALTAGHHPYGDRYEREVNIIRNEKVGMAKLDPLGEDGHEAGEILDLLLSPRAEDRCACRLFLYAYRPTTDSLTLVADLTLPSVWSTLCSGLRQNDWLSCVMRLIVSLFAMPDSRSKLTLLSRLRNHGTPASRAHFDTPRKQSFSRGRAKLAETA